MKKNIWRVLFSLFLLLCLFPEEAKANDQSESDGFYVTPILPENQREGINTYYDLMIKPNDTQEVQLVVINKTNDFQKFSVVIENSFTNDDVSIGYGNLNQYDETLKAKLTDLVRAPTETELEPHEAKTLSFTIKAPKEPFKGMVLGGIRVTEASDDKQAAGGVSNLFSYVLPIKLRMSTDPIKQELVFKDIIVKKNRKAIEVKASIQNPQPALISELTLTTKVFNEKQQEPLAVKTMKNLQVAPNTQFYPNIYLGKKALRSGEYRIQVSVKGKELSETWEKTITLKKDEVKEVNKGFHVKNTTSERGKIIWVSLIVIFLLFTGFLLWIRKRRKS